MSADDARTEVVDRMRGLFLPPRDMPEGMESRALSEYIDALKGYSRDALESAWRVVRDGHKTRGWPTISAFKSAAHDASKRTPSGQQESNAEGRMTEHGWQPWAGCQCDRCIGKTPSEGFFHAAKGEREARAAITRDCEDWMWRRMYGPGTPPVAHFTGEEIIITPERARAVIEVTRKRFNYSPKYKPGEERQEPRRLAYEPTPDDVKAAREKALRDRLGDDDIGLDRA